MSLEKPASVRLNDLALRDRASTVIPGGMYGHQRVDPMLPSAPQFFASADGCRIRDVDGNEYIDFLCSYGPNILGHHHPLVDEAVARQQLAGDCMTGPGEVMIELAESFVGTVEHADWAMFAKNGTDATTMCLSIARLATGKRSVLVADGSYHGAAPWCTPGMGGVIPSDRQQQIRYTFNDIDSLEWAVGAAGNDFAALIVSAYKHDAFVDSALPTVEFAKRARELCDAHGAVLIVDDVRAGFRLTMGCSWELIGVEPDLSAWGNAIANGYPISAVLGADELRHAASRIYTTGSFWFSAAAMAAAVATIETLRTEDAIRVMSEMGQRFRQGLDEQARRHGFSLRQTGPSQMPRIVFDDDRSLHKTRLWCDEAIRRGVYLHPWHNMFLSAAHTVDDIDMALTATEGAFASMRKQL